MESKEVIEIPLGKARERGRHTDAPQGFHGRDEAEGSNWKQGRQQGCLTTVPAGGDCQANTITVQPAYLQEWNYRFNRRSLITYLFQYIIKRAVNSVVITYKEVDKGIMPINSLHGSCG
jgi:hypothetical protein